MAISTLPPKRAKATEATIDAFINGGGQPAPTPTNQDDFDPDRPRHINTRLTDGIIRDIDELRAKRPRRPGSPKFGISLHDWVVEAVIEKIDRERKKK